MWATGRLLAAEHALDLQNQRPERWEPSRPSSSRERGTCSKLDSAFQPKEPQVTHSTTLLTGEASTFVVCPVVGIVGGHVGGWRCRCSLSLALSTNMRRASAREE